MSSSSTKGAFMSRLSRALISSLSATLLLAAAGCGSSDDVSAEEPNSCSKFNDMNGTERTDALAAAAKKEGNLYVYGTTTDSGVIVEGFKKKYPSIKVKLYAADTEATAARLTQEKQAGKSPADVFEGSSHFVKQMADTGGMFAPYESEQRDEIPEEAKGELWTAVRVIAFVVGYNTDLVPQQERPLSFEDFADPKWKGELSVELEDYDWYMALAMYYTEEKGWTMEKFDAMMKSIIANSSPVKGHSAQAGLVVAGKFGVAMSQHSDKVDELSANGAPITWKDPSVSPVPVRHTGMALVDGAPNCAAAMLFMDFELDPEGGVAIDLETNAVPALPSESDALTGAELYYIDLDELIDNGQDWAARWDSILRNANS